MPRFQRSHCLHDGHACLAVRSLRLPDNAFKQSQGSLVSCRHCRLWLLVARKRQILICIAIKANCRPTSQWSTDIVITTSNMNPTSHDAINATGDETSLQPHNATEDTQETPDETLEWPEEVFKSLNVPASGMQRMKVSSVSWQRSDEIPSANSLRLRRSLRMTIM